MRTGTHATLRAVGVVAVLLALALAGPALAGADSIDAGQATSDGSDATVEEVLNATEWTAADTAEAGNVTVSLAPGDAAAKPGEQKVYDVVVTGAEGGISAYDFELAIDDPGVAAIVDYETTNEPFLYNATISDDGAVLDAMVALGDNKYDPAEKTVVATATVEANESLSAGSAELDVVAAGVMDNENVFYNVTDTAGAEFVVDADAVTVEAAGLDGERLVGSPVSLAVTVESPHDGISAFEVTLAVDGGTVLDYALPRGGTDGSHIADNGSAVTLDVDLDEPYDPAESVTVAEVTVVGNTSPLAVEPTSATLTGLGGDSYVTGSVGGSATLVEGPPPLPGLDGRPTDLTGDLLVEDIDGDRSFDIFDVQALFNHFDSESVQEHAGFFDFNDDGGVAIFDVQALFNRLASGVDG